MTAQPIRWIRPGAQVRLAQARLVHKHSVHDGWWLVAFPGKETTSGVLIHEDHIQEVIQDQSVDDRVKQLEDQLAEASMKIQQMKRRLSFVGQIVSGKAKKIELLDSHLLEPTDEPKWSVPILGEPNPAIPSQLIQVLHKGKSTWIQATDHLDEPVICYRIVKDKTIPWSGGSQPVPAHWKVKVHFRNGEVSIARADSFLWHQMKHYSDIVSFEIVEDRKTDD